MVVGARAFNQLVRRDGTVAATTLWHLFFLAMFSSLKIA